MAVTLGFTDGRSVQIAEAASAVASTIPGCLDLSSALPGGPTGNIVGGFPIANVEYWTYQN